MWMLETKIRLEGCNYLHFINPVSGTHNKLFIGSRTPKMRKKTLAYLWGAHRFSREARVKLIMPMTVRLLILVQFLS